MKLIYKDQDTRCRFRTLTLNMFKADLSGFPKLKGRAGEIRDFGPVLREMWRHGMQSGVAWQQTVLDTLEASCTIDELLHVHRDDFAFEGSTYERFSLPSVHTVSPCKVCIAKVADKYLIAQPSCMRYGTLDTTVSGRIPACHGAGWAKTS